MKFCLRVMTLVLLLLQPGYFSAQEKSAEPAVADEAQKAWTRFEKVWTPSPDLMRPLSDPVWKVQYETLVLSMRAGKDAAPILNGVMANSSLTVKEWANQVGNLSRNRSPEATATRQALASFDLARLDSARYGKPAPDFELTDLTGKTWRLSQMRGKKNVALIFLGYAG